MPPNLQTSPFHLLAIALLLSPGFAVAEDPVQLPVVEAAGWFFSAGTSVRTIHTSFDFGAGDPDLLDWRNFFDGRSSRNPGLYSGADSPVVYDDGSVGPQNPNSPPGVAIGTVDTEGQVLPHPLGEDNGFLNAVLAFHTGGYAYRTESGPSQDVDDTTAGPSLNWGYRLGEVHGIRLNLVSGWTFLRSQHSTGPVTVVEVFEDQIEFTYLYDYINVQGGTLPGVIDGDAGIIYDAALITPIFGEGYQSPRERAETVPSATPRFYAVSRADLDVSLNELPFGIEAGRSVGPVELYLTTGLTFNAIHYELTNELAWYEQRSDTPRFQKTWRDSGSPIKAGLFGGIAAKLPLTPSGRVYLDASTTYRWVDPVHAFRWQRQSGDRCFLVGRTLWDWDRAGLIRLNRLTCGSFASELLKWQVPASKQNPAAMILPNFRLTSLLPLLVLATSGIAEEPRAILPDKHHGLLKEHCQSCHGAEKQKGKFRIDELPFTITDNINAERWQKVLNALNSEEMPPEEEKQPAPDTKADFLEDLAKVMVAARRNLGDTKGVITMRRLNQREYGNTLRDLLGVPIAVNELPSDTNASGFDTAGTNLFMSGDQFEQYLELGREAVVEAFERHDRASVVKKERFEAEKGLLERVNKSLKQRIEFRMAYNKWTRAVDKAAAAPENHRAVAEIRAALKGQPAHFFYHSWAKLKGAPSPVDYGFTDAVNASHEASDGTWNRNVPYQSWFVAQPENLTGGWLTVGITRSILLLLQCPRLAGG